MGKECDEAQREACKDVVSVFLIIALTDTCVCF